MWNWPLAPSYDEAEIKLGRGARAPTANTTPCARLGSESSDPPRRHLISTPLERSLSSMDAPAIRRAYESSAGAAKVTGAACRRLQRLLGRDRLRSVGSVRSQANEARRHAGGRTSGNGPDTTERAPLDARGWVPSVFRARPANDKESERAMPATPTVTDRRWRDSSGVQS